VESVGESASGRPEDVGRQPVDLGSQTLRTVQRYNYELWNEQKYEIAREIIGAEVVRHEPGVRHVLTHDMAVQRVRDLWSEVRTVTFDLLHTVVDGELCTIVYQADFRTHEGAAGSIASIEVFRVVNGLIVEVWNNSHDQGRWPEAKEFSL
jgi:predicted SnoaL-like aldol condensation-catalyzing enzyme